MKQTRSLSEVSCLSEYTRLYHRYLFFVAFLGLQSSSWGKEGWLLYLCGLLNVMFKLMFRLPLPQGAVGWSVVCDCSISWPRGFKT